MSGLNKWTVEKDKKKKKSNVAKGTVEVANCPVFLWTAAEPDYSNTSNNKQQEKQFDAAFISTRQ